MTDPYVPPVDPSEDPAPVEPVEPEEDDADLDPEADPVPPEDETPEQLKARLAATEERNKKLWARLQREKNKGKQPATPAASPASASTPAASAAAPALTREEAIVIAKGHSEEELERAKKIAAVEGIGLVAALDTDLFKDWKAKKDKDAKDRAAQLPASRGGKPVVKKSLATPGLSDEDHKALFQERIGK